MHHIYFETFVSKEESHNDVGRFPDMLHLQENVVSRYVTSVCFSNAFFAVVENATIHEERHSHDDECMILHLIILGLMF